ncbi:hypothetical protein DY000_02046162 [Brassica cretica]|uniref:Uncharacterized protein n=1 Tax=Brassica cretica TaxID=69181 RepID=A0ABQ7F495_BRACR|nr:hypothetical protein DY000_02046162 [Brassica cretica]
MWVKEIVRSSLSETPHGRRELDRARGVYNARLELSLRLSDPVSVPRASASEIELDAIIGGGRLLDPSCFMSSLEFVYASLGFRELDSSRDIHLLCFWSVKLIGERTNRGEMSLLLRNLHREVEISGAPGDSQW